MKQKILSIAAGVLGLAVVTVIAIKSHATDFPVARHDNTQNETLIAPTLLQTNLAGDTFDVEKNNYHAIQVINTGTNASYVGIDRSLDGSHWVVGWTQVVAAASSNDTNIVGKWHYIKTRCYSTNSPMTVLYLGGN